ncbi:MAG: HPF/RaiA family ribosome-associated protein [Bacillota bacterium]
MPLALQVTLHRIPPSDALQSSIAEHAAKLERLESRVTRCRVTVDEDVKRHRRGNRFEVRVELRAPAHRDIAVHRHDEDVYVALRDAFDTASRRLRESEHGFETARHPVY